MEPLSPELALVDEQLDRSARLEIPEQPDYLTTVESAYFSKPRRTRSALTLGGGGLLVALLAGLFAFVLVRSDRGPSPGASQPVATTAVGQARTTNTVLELRWQPVPGAEFYNVILWRNDVRALDLWPKNASVRVSKERLEPGVYQWFVYPMLGDGGGRQYGLVTARGNVRV